MNFIQEYKRAISIIACILALVFVGQYLYKKKLAPNIYKYQYTQMLKKAADIPGDYWDEKYKDVTIKDSYKVAMIVYGGGDYSYTEFFKFAAERIGWKVEIYYRNRIDYEQDILAFDPDFITFTNQGEYILEPKLKVHRSKKYILSLMPVSQSMKHKSEFRRGEFPIIDSLAEGLKISDGLFSSAKEMDVYRSIVESYKKEFNGIEILPLVPQTANNPAEPESLMWYGMAWENDSRYSNKYKDFITSLSKNIPMKIYGSYRNSTYVAPNVYDGYIPSALEIIDAIRKNGIYLLTHSDMHIESKSPTLRIFEAISANAVVISDMHPFAMENFGDNFLYFDQTADAETMYKQVKDHVDWIKANPEKAKAMAARAHKIFLEKFTLEKDLTRIAKMHEYVLQQERKKGLSYPLVY